MIYFKVFLVLLLILGLIGITAIALKSLRNKGLIASQKNLKLDEVLYLDRKRKLVFVSLYDKRYLILLGESDILIDVVSKK